MVLVSASTKCLKLAAACLIAVSLAACASNKDGQDGAGGAGGAGGRRFGSGSASPGSVQDFKVNVGDTVRFETDSSELTSTATATLDNQVQWLQRYPRVSFTISGHADERGTREYNFALGARRAETVKNYLVAKGISSSRIRTTSLGKEQPVATCDDISCWSQNRRAVTILGGGGV